MRSLYVSLASLFAVYGGAALMGSSAGANGIGVFDLNNDNRVSAEEAAGTIENFEQFDLDGNGSLDEQEFSRLVRHAELKRQMKIEQINASF